MNRKYGFTIIELMTSVAIIALLAGILIPSIYAVRSFAKNTEQRAQMNAIGLGLETFKNDYGDYPPSDQYGYAPQPPYYYNGAQKLSEALLGWDLKGFHPDSAWRSDGRDEAGAGFTYDPDGTRGTDSLYERKGPYLDVETANPFTLGELFNLGTFRVRPNNYVICDVYPQLKVIRNDISGNPYVVKAGTPVLYFKANTASKTISDTTTHTNNIYNPQDNKITATLVNPDGDTTFGDLYYNSDNKFAYFYDYITDPLAPGAWPYNPETYILISAGRDGIYGTEDDITNFPR